MKSDAVIYIIGAGISGLIAAYELEMAGYSPIILESSDEVGGRVRTDKFKDYLLDRGFQVLLTAYPEAQRYLDYEALKLKKFSPGAIILKPGNSFIIHDPLRNPLKLINMVFSGVGTFLDKIKIFSLTKSLEKKSIEEIFQEPSQTTLQFLKDYGFSDKIIDNFFKPFFSGIFLENELNTSSRMFKFVFKMFAMGHAAIPENGMQQIAEQLKNKLTKSQIIFNSPVKKIEGTTLYLSSGGEIQADRIIVATKPDKLIPQLSGQFKAGRKVINIYYSIFHSFVAQPMIALVTDPQFLINNLVFMTDISKAYSQNTKALLSVSIVKPVESIEKLEKMVAIELEALTKIKAEYFEHIKTYLIEEALPQVEDFACTLSPTNTKVLDGVYLAGDFLLNGSINAAMTAGRKAAEAVILSLQPTY
ncbi:NAD(P)/FAD-dependent oxidoreductase [Shivajiella indica]|uniref:NAD(P)/FAD-dependent oxidoreductase n=1 Tax=Shivajiella indica TaxID=872115 RepID=A0ABW5B8N8_9BACT